MREERKPSPLVRFKDFAFIKVKASFKLFGNLISIGTLFTLGGISTAIVAGDYFDPISAHTPILAAEETAPNILIEIRDTVREIAEQEFPPGPPTGLPAEFREQVDGIEAQLDCLADVLNGVETSC